MAIDYVCEVTGGTSEQQEIAVETVYDGLPHTSSAHVINHVVHDNEKGDIPIQVIVSGNPYEVLTGLSPLDVEGLVPKDIRSMTLSEYQQLGKFRPNRVRIDLNLK
jgi:hypothetical protein